MSKKTPDANDAGKEKTQEFSFDKSCDLSEETADLAVREMMQIVNRRAKKEHRVSYEDCLQVVRAYPRYEDFVRYGLNGFCNAHNLTQAQQEILKNARSYFCAPDLSRYIGRYVGDWYSIAAIVRELFDGEQTECAYIIYVDSDMRIIDGFKRIGFKNRVSLVPDDVFTHRPFVNTCCYFIAHNHISGDYNPGSSDLKSSLLFMHAANDCTCGFLDSIIVSYEYVHSIMFNRTLFFHPFMNTVELLKSRCTVEGGAEHSLTEQV